MTWWQKILCVDKIRSRPRGILCVDKIGSRPRGILCVPKIKSPQMSALLHLFAHSLFENRAMVDFQIVTCDLWFGGLFADSLCKNRALVDFTCDLRFGGLFADSLFENRALLDFQIVNHLWPPMRATRFSATPLWGHLAQLIQSIRHFSSLPTISGSRIPS